MIKRITGVGILFLLLSANAFAEFAIYTIGNQFEAVFPANPQFTGEIGEGKQKLRSYNYTDESNLIVYTATYQVGKTYFSNNDVSEALNNYVKGQALVVKGNVTSYSKRIIDGNDSAVFSIQYQCRGVPVRKYGVVAYKNGQFFQWAVQDFPSMSSLSAKNIFNRYVVNFSIK